MRLLLAAVCCCLWLTVPARAERTIAFTNAHIIPIQGDEIAKGTLVISGKTIRAVGAADAVEIPAGAETVDLAGKFLMPGLVCTHSHIGGGGGADGSGPVQPGVRILDSINVHDSGFKRA